MGPPTAGAGPPARQRPAFPLWIPIVVVAAVAVVAILLATRGGNDKDVVTAGATTIAANTATSLASPTTIGNATTIATGTNSPDGVFRAFADAVIAGRCIDALGLMDTANRRLVEALKLSVCECSGTIPPRAIGSMG